MKIFTTCFLFLMLLASTSKGQCSAAFSYTVIGTNPTVIQFTDSSNGGGVLVNYAWDFGDGLIGTTSNPIHTYNVVGTFQVCLTITTAGGCTDTYCQLITVGGTGTGVNISYFSADSMSSNCSLPAAVNYSIYGMAYGTAGTGPIDIYYSFGDGTDTSFQVSLPQPPYFGSYNIIHTYTNPGSYTAYAIASSSLTGEADTVNSFTTIVLSNSCGNIGGNVYLDNNSNCTFDAGDSPLSYVWVNISSGGSVVSSAYTDINGAYNFNLPTGATYDISINGVYNSWYNNQYNVLCPNSGSINVSSVPSAGNDFYLTCPLGFDLTGNIYGWGFRPGLVNYINAYVYDYYCSSPSGTVYVILDPLLTPLPDSSSNYTISGDTLIWNFTGGTTYWNYNYFFANVLVSPNAQIGDSICLTMIIEPIAGDSVPSNNIITACFPVVNSWDPNDKRAMPFGVGANHAIRPEQRLDYTIRFQNTGTASAINVFILDTIDSNLDMNTLEFTGSSHAVVPQILNGGIVKFQFDNINLPDSNSNEAGSHGFVSYKISPKTTVVNGAVIENTAGIYFDFNQPVITNTTFHTIDQFLAVNENVSDANSISVYPNPASKQFTISSKDIIEKVEMFDVSGQLVMKLNADENKITFNSTSLSAGTYFIKTTTANSISHSRVIIVQ